MNKYMGIAAAFLATISVVCSHGNMLLPITWLDKETSMWYKGERVYGFAGIKSGLQCTAGLKLPSKDLCPSLPNGCEFLHPGGVCYWYKNYTKVDEPKIFDPVMRTYGIYEKYWYSENPWRAPGRAPIDSPCGVVGGNMNGCVGGPCAHYKGGFAYGVKAENFKFPHQIFVTNWTRGEEVEVAWGIGANHGGGYSYRLCKIPEAGVSSLTEECFQQTPLDFVGNMQWVQYGEDRSTRVSFVANRTRSGTFPIGSQWTKNPIPGCTDKMGGFFNPTRECIKGYQFPPPKPKLYGFGVNTKRTVENFQFSIIDRIKIPKEIPAGDYVLSFRWDCEQTPQVWNTCSSIHLQ